MSSMIQLVQSPTSVALCLCKKARIDQGKCNTKQATELSSLGLLAIMRVRFAALLQARRVTRYLQQHKTFLMILRRHIQNYPLDPVPSNIFRSIIICPRTKNVLSWLVCFGSHLLLLLIDYYWFILLLVVHYYYYYCVLLLWIYYFLLLLVFCPLVLLIIVDVIQCTGLNVGERAVTPVTVGVFRQMLARLKLEKVQKCWEPDRNIIWSAQWNCFFLVNNSFLYTFLML